MNFLFTLILSLSTVVSCADLPDLMRSAIRQYQAVDTSKFLECLRYGGEGPPEMTTEHKVIKAHYDKLRGFSWMTIWPLIIKALLEKKYFSECGKKGVNCGRVAFLKILLRDNGNAIKNATANERAYLQTLKNALESDDLTFQDVGSAYCFTAFVLVHANIEIAKSDKIFQDYLKTGTTSRFCKRKANTLDFSSSQPEKKLRVTDLDKVPLAASASRNNIQARSPTNNEAPSLLGSQTNVLSEQQEYSSSDEDYFLEALLATEYNGNSCFSFPYLETAFPDTTEKST